ncbi:MAG: GFA family protein [Pseudomonadota bacterium]
MSSDSQPSAMTGGCACGEVRYQVEGVPLLMSNCHCRDCQHATGSAYLPAVIVKRRECSFVIGELTWYESVADAGHAMQRGFCATCGSPVALQNGAAPGVTVLYAASLDDPAAYAPSRDIYVASAQPWDVMHAELEKFAGMP